MKLAYHENPIYCAGMQPEEDLLDLAVRINVILSVAHDYPIPAYATNKTAEMISWVHKSPLNYRWLQKVGSVLCSRYAQINRKRPDCEYWIKDRFIDPPDSIIRLPMLWTEPPKEM